MKFKIDRKTWTIRKGDTPSAAHCGSCCWTDREIILHRRLGKKLHLETTVHELIHAAQPEMTEKEVLRLEKTIAGVLWRAGYRKRK